MASLSGFKGILGVDRSSRLKVLFKIGFLKKFANFTEKHLYGSLFFNKGAACKPATLSKKKTREICFPVKFAKFLRISFL